MLACDHSTGGVIIGGSLQRAGFGGGVIRYSCGGRSDVNITPAEVQDLKTNGVPLGLVLEHEADWLLRSGVRQRVEASVQVARACNVPDGVLYLAADWDCTNGGPTSPGSPGDNNMRGIAAALNTAADVIGRQNVGFYGSYFGIDWLIKNLPWLRWFWQTEAWSMRMRHAAACLFQRAEYATVAGVQLDVDEIWKPSWGQRTATPTPSPSPTPIPPEDTVSIALGSNEDGRAICVVQLASGEVKHIEQEHVNSDWWKDNKGHFKWISLGNPGPAFPPNP